LAVEGYHAVFHFNRDKTGEVGDCFSEVCQLPLDALPDCAPLEGGLLDQGGAHVVAYSTVTHLHGGGYPEPINDPTDFTHTGYQFQPDLLCRHMLHFSIQSQDAVAEVNVDGIPVHVDAWLTLKGRSDLFYHFLLDRHGCPLFLNFEKL
jgi:hypothetical protein